eukprot:5906232-Karenia_brevis.AAC.1
MPTPFSCCMASTCYAESRKSEVPPPKANAQHALPHKAEARASVHSTTKTMRTITMRQTRG